MKELPIYPGHAITLACQIARAFPSLEAARQPTGHGFPAALGSDEVDGAGGNVYAALEALVRLERGESLDSVLEWADSGWRSLARSNGFPADGVIDEGQQQARRFLAHVDLVAWVKAEVGV